MKKEHHPFLVFFPFLLLCWGFLMLLFASCRRQEEWLRKGPGLQVN
jgi:hypothetical protein